MKAAASLLAIALALPAAAQEPATPTLSTIIAGLEAQGYRVTDVDVDRDQIEVEAQTGDGRAVELRIDAVTGEILGETADD
jgi:uncharacterized membrane protein YkoI